MNFFCSSLSVKGDYVFLLSNVIIYEVEYEDTLVTEHLK